MHGNGSLQACLRKTTLVCKRKQGSRAGAWGEQHVRLPSNLYRKIPLGLQAAVVAVGESRSLLPQLQTELHRRAGVGSAVPGSAPGGGLKAKALEAAAAHGLPAMPAAKAIPILSA